MNRKKKLNQIFNKRLKKAKAKLNPNQKDKYVSKADREAEKEPELDLNNDAPLTPSSD